MSDKEDIRKVLEASRKSGPMDKSMVRGTAELSTKKDDGYYADAIRGTKYLQFSQDEETVRIRNKFDQYHWCQISMWSTLAYMWTMMIVKAVVSKKILFLQVMLIN